MAEYTLIDKYEQAYEQGYMMAKQSSIVERIDIRIVFITFFNQQIQIYCYWHSSPSTQFQYQRGQVMQKR